MSGKEASAANLANLPFELLSHIHGHLSAAHSVSSLSKTCRKLHDFSQKEGWKAFVREHFPSFNIHPDLKNYADAAHGLTTLSRNWDRRAFVARYIEPAGYVTDSTSGAQVRQWRAPAGQTMGYRPAIDSYEEWLNVFHSPPRTDWGSRRQVLAWSAGAELIIRIQETGALAQQAWQSSQVENPDLLLDDQRHFTQWHTWRHKGSREGRDDITAVKLIKPVHKFNENPRTESILVGDASGRLDLISNPSDPNYYVPVTSFATGGRSIRSMDISDSSQSTLITAVLSDTKLALYPLHAEQNVGTVNAVSEVEPITDRTRDCRIWTTKFLSDTKVAAGLGPSTEPLQVFDVNPSGFDATPIRKFGLNDTHWSPDDRVEFEPYTQKTSSIYPISPLPATSQAGHVKGDVFLSGCYDGIIRLHDLRSPEEHVGSYWDPVDDSAIFSLQTLGRERLVAGASRHSMLKVFDLRVAGGRAYHYLGMEQLQGSGALDPENQSAPRHGWNVFITPHNRHPMHSRLRNRSSSPIYSLSSPSSVSPTIFAGLENAVVQFDFVSILDQYPDPLYSRSLYRVHRTGEIDIKRTWNSRGRVMNLGMYEQGGNDMRLRVQRGVGKYYSGSSGRERLQELDERWVDASAGDVARTRENSLFP